MSGKVGGVQKRIQDIVKEHRTDGTKVLVPFVHCTSTHDLNLVINDAAEASLKESAF